MKAHGYGGPRPDQELITKAASLAQAAPREWQDFCETLKRYSATAATLCVAAPAVELPRMQGRAQQMLEITTLFADVVKTANRITHKPAGPSAAVNWR